MKLAAMLLLGALASACSGGTTGVGAAGNDTASRDDAEVTGADTTADDPAGPDATVPDGSMDAVADGAAPDADASDDAPPDDAPPDAATPDAPAELPPDVFDPCVGPAAPGVLPVGAPCLAHAECQTGYCYDEAWKDAPDNAGFRFCTIGCSSCLKACSEWDSLTAGATCLLFLAAEANEHDLAFRSLCMATCQTDADCQAASGGVLGACRYATHWDGSSIGLQKVCFPQ